MPTRNSDGRFRNHNKPTVVSADTLRAQWVEMEAMRLKRDAFSYETIAERITQVGRGQKVPVTPLPEGIHFPPDYKITAMGCNKAVIDTERCEEMYLFGLACSPFGRAIRKAPHLIGFESGSSCQV
jgi:hypothetical protein